MLNKLMRLSERSLLPEGAAHLYNEEKLDDGAVLVQHSDVRRRGTLQRDDTNGTPQRDPPETKMIMHRALSGLKMASKPVQAWLSYYARTSGAANTDFAFGYAIQPNQDTSWASWQAVFDEVKVLSAELVWQVWFSVLPTGFATQTPNAVIVYEPSTAPNLASVNAGLQYEHFQLLNVGSNSNGTYATAPQSIAKGGHMVFKAKIPKGEVLSNVTTTVSAGLWRPTTDASNYNWGTFLGYCAAGGNTSVLQIEGFVRMRCEFRTRR